MTVTVALEARYSITPDGTVWSQAGMARRFWERYLEAFDGVRIVARGVRVERAPDGWLPVTGGNITFHAVPNYCGPWQYLRRLPAVHAAIGCTVPAEGAVILRVPSQIGSIMAKHLRRTGRPYALEVVGDPYEVFAPGVVDHPVRPFLRWHFTRQLREQCHRAVGVAYVTERSLQERYPSRTMGVGVSDVCLSQEAFREPILLTEPPQGKPDRQGCVKTREGTRSHRKWRLATVGSLAQRYKGTDVLVEALQRCVRAGLDLTLVIVGDGRYKPALMTQAERLGMVGRIQFIGQVTAGEPVRRILDSADLFVLPSRTEGLPRALIEAMARGLPCIGSDVGGIPELLDASELVPAGDSTALAAKIREVLENPGRMEMLSRRNIEKAAEYREPILVERRRRFYQHVRDVTDHWIAARRRGR